MAITIAEELWKVNAKKKSLKCLLSLIIHYIIIQFLIVKTSLSSISANILVATVRCIEQLCCEV